MKMVIASHPDGFASCKKRLFNDQPEQTKLRRKDDVRTLIKNWFASVLRENAVLV